LQTFLHLHLCKDYLLVLLLEQVVVLHQVLLRQCLFSVDLTPLLFQQPVPVVLELPLLEPLPHFVQMPQPELHLLVCPQLYRYNFLMSTFNCSLS
jgi:hypothetical protein